MDKWAKLRVGDALLCKTEDGEEIKLLVRDLLYHDNFEDLYAACGASLLPDLPTTAWEIYSRFPCFSAKDEKQYGVVGVKIMRM